MTSETENGLIECAKAGEDTKLFYSPSAKAWEIHRQGQETQVVEGSAYPRLPDGKWKWLLDTRKDARFTARKPARKARLRDKRAATPKNVKTEADVKKARMGMRLPKGRLPDGRHQTPAEEAAAERSGAAKRLGKKAKRDHGRAQA